MFGRKKFLLQRFSYLVFRTFAFLPNNFILFNRNAQMNVPYLKAVRRLGYRYQNKKLWM